MAGKGIGILPTIIIAFIIAGAAYYFVSSGIHGTGNTTSSGLHTINTTTSAATTAVGGQLSGIQGNVSIDRHYTCTPKTSPTGYKYYELSLTGTANGPPGTMLSVFTTGVGGTSHVQCMGWTPVGSGVIHTPRYESEAKQLNYPCFRDMGGPANMNWTTIIDNLTQSMVDQSGGLVTVDVLINVYANISSDGTVTLQPVSNGEATNNSYLADLAIYNLSAACHI